MTKSLATKNSRLGRIEFSFSPSWRILSWLGLASFCVSLVLGTLIWCDFLNNIHVGAQLAVNDVATDFGMPDTEIEIMLFSLLPIAASLFFGVIRLMEPASFWENQSEGILIACYTLGPIGLTGHGDWFIWGLASWSNIVDVGTVHRGFFWRGIGLQLDDLDAFLKTRRSLKREDFIARARRGPSWARLYIGWIVASPVGKFVGLVWNIRGLTAPKSVEENDVLQWNYDNFGYHIMIPRRSLRCAAAEILSEVESWRQSATKLEASPSNDT